MTKTYSDKDWINLDVEIRTSPIHGRGMFALRTFAPGEVIAIWGGPYVGRVAAEEATAAGKPIQQIEDDVFAVIDRDTPPDPSYWQNHSCEPNTAMRDEVTVITRRAVQPGEELTLDYAMIELDEKWVMRWECRCGTPACRRVITGRDWRRRELQQRYGAHFTPVINRRIAALDSRTPTAERRPVE